MIPSLLRICTDGTMRHVNEAVSTPTLCFVETILIPARTTATGYEYYTSKVLNLERTPVEGNFFEWKGIRCRLDETDRWDSDNDHKKEFDIDGIVLVAHIVDRLGVERRVPFHNNRHDGRAWNDLSEYLQNLERLGSHEAMKEVRALKMALAKQQEENNALRQKLQKATSPSA